MQGMSPADWNAQRPALSPANEIVVAIWNFCGGWKPEALPIALAFYDVADVELCVSQLLAMREKQKTREQLSQMTNG